MAADLVLEVLQEPTADLGFVASIAIGDELLVAVGRAFVLASSNARHFETRTTPREPGLRDVLVAGDAWWVCGEVGQLAVSRDRGASWRTLETGTKVCLSGLALAAGAVWVVGEDGYAARVAGDHVERVAFGTTARLSSVYAVRDEIVALGVDGQVRRWRAGVMTTVGTGPRPLTALAITRIGTWIVTGEDGFVARSPDGMWFSRVASGVEVDLEAVATLADGRIVIAGDRGQILLSDDDGRSWRGVASPLVAHLWSVERFGGGALIAGDGGLIVKLAPAADQTWHDRVSVFGAIQPLDAAFAHGPAGFIVDGLPVYLAAIEDEDEGEDDDDDDEDDDDEDDEDDDDDDDEEDEGDDDDGAERTDRSALRALGKPGDARAFAQIYGMALPAEVVAFFAATSGVDRWHSFEELRLDSQLRPDVGERNLFELMVRRNQLAYLGTDLVEAFCGVFAIGSQGNGDTYHMELYEWDGPRQVLHYDHETAAFSGVFADSLDSLVYLAALVKARDVRKLSPDAFAMGLRKLRGKVSPTWHFSIADKDPDFVTLEPKRRDTEFFFYRSRWITALLKHDGITEVADIAGLFQTDFNQAIAADQLPARYEACERFIPTALYAMWRAYLFDEPELDRYLEIGRSHAARLVRDAAVLIDELRGGRNQLGTIDDVGAWLASFRALDLDPRRAAAREAEAVASAEVASARHVEVVAELELTAPDARTDHAWRWLDDGVAHRALLELLDRMPHAAAQIAALDELRGLRDHERAVALPLVAAELSAELETLLVGSLVRNDPMTGVLSRPGAGAPSGPRVHAALDMIERALGLAPDDVDVQFTYAMLLLDADRAGVAGHGDALLQLLPSFAPPVRINVAVRMGANGHPLFARAVDAALAAQLGDEVAHELFSELGEAILAHAPDRMPRLIAVLPDQLELLTGLAAKAADARQSEPAIALFERALALPIPDDGDQRTSYLRALNSACIQAHAAKAYDAAVRIANRAQPVAHENPYIYHSAACAYAAVGDYAKALDQVRLAVQHDYDHLGKVEVDGDLGPLLDWPEFKTLFREWHARQESN